MRVSFLLVLVLPFLPAADHAATLHGRFTETRLERTVPAGDEIEIPLTWRVDFEETTCTAAVDVGVDFIVEDSPLWLGVDFDPDAAQAKYPGGTGPTTAFVFADPDATVGARTTVLLTLFLNPQNGAGNCTPVPTKREDTTALVVTIAEGSPSTVGTVDTPTTTGTPRGTPGFEAVAAVAAVAVLAARRR